MQTKKNSNAKPAYIVTGTTRGIGRALAEKILKQGHRLYSLTRRPDNGTGLQHFFYCDLSDTRLVPDAMNRLHLRSKISILKRWKAEH